MLQSTMCYTIVVECFLQCKIFWVQYPQQSIQNPESGGYPSYSELPNKYWGEGERITGGLKLWLIALID